MKNYIILSEKSWNKNLASEISSTFGGNWKLIDSRKDFNIETITSYDPQYIFIPHWSHYISREIYKNFNCVVFHITDLPYGRGGSPLQNLIIRGHEETNITAIKVVEEIDAGSVYLKKSMSLLGTAHEIYLRANDIIKKMIIEILENSPILCEQSGEVTHFSRRTPKDGNLESANTLKQVYDMIRMLDAEDYPLAFFKTDRFTIKFSRASFRGDSILADVLIEANNE